MNEQRLADIERNHADRLYDLCGRNWPCDAALLLTEVRRLKKAVDQAYSDGESNKEADIVGIILDAEDEFDAMIQIKHSLGWEED